MNDVENVLVIPHDQRATVDAKSRQHIVAKINHECAVSRYNKAVKAGDADLALQEFDTGEHLELERNAAVDAFWAFIRELFPEVTNGNEWQFNSTDYTVRKINENSLLGRMLQSVVGG